MGIKGKTQGKACGGPSGRLWSSGAKEVAASAAAAAAVAYQARRDPFIELAFERFLALELALVEHHALPLSSELEIEALRERGLLRDLGPRESELALKTLDRLLELTDSFGGLRRHGARRDRASC
jgi:hypothetical protein